MASDEEVRAVMQRIADAVIDVVSGVIDRGVPPALATAATIGAVAALSAAHHLKREDVISGLHSAFDDIEGVST